MEHVWASAFSFVDLIIEKYKSITTFLYYVPLLPFLVGESALVGDRAGDLLSTRLPSLDEGREPFLLPEPNHTQKQQH